MQFLWKQLKSKEEMNNSLLNRLVKCNILVKKTQSMIIIVIIVITIFIITTILMIIFIIVIVLIVIIDFVFKSCLKEQTNLVDKGEVLKTDFQTGDVLNTFCGNIVKDLEANLYSNFEQLNFLINRSKQNYCARMTKKLTNDKKTY